MSVSGAGERKVYRPPVICMALAWVASAGFFVVGLSMVTIGPSQHDGASAVAVGAVVLLFSLWVGAVAATNRLVVTPAGLVYSYYLRRRAVSWAEIQSFGVGGTRGMMRWPTVVIWRNDSSAVVTNLASLTRTYPARIADELTAWHRRLAPPRSGSSRDTGVREPGTR